ncbi:unnamed protein product [Colias eurytheme]|nr:unnamed protein product [Colias eurytheme]
MDYSSEEEFDYYINDRIFEQRTIITRKVLLIINDLIKLTERGLPVPPMYQLLIAIRFYSSGSFQMVTGDLIEVSEPYEELFQFLPAAQFHHQTTRRKNQFHPHHLDGWRSTTVRSTRNFLPRTVKLWNDLPPAVFPNNDIGAFMKITYLLLLFVGKTPVKLPVFMGGGDW